MYTFINWEDLELKKSSGSEKVKCPVCHSEKNRKNDTSIQVNHSGGYAKCFRCESLSFRDSKTESDHRKEYKLPVQQWQNYTALSETMVKYFSGRGISQSTLVDLNITEEKYYQPQANKETNNIVFNYFEREIIVNKKYRSAKKEFTQSAGTKNIFYNINSVIGKKEVWIVEGEMDVLSLHEVGIKSCISVPNGANDNDDVWLNCKNYLEGVEKFIIAVDNDSKGKELKEKIAQRLGRYRCEFIEFKSGKDANDCLQQNSLLEELKNRKRFPVSGTFSTMDLKDSILELHANGLPPTIKVESKCFKGGENEKDFNDVFSVMRGHLVTVTGIPSHGKSNFSEWYALNLLNDNDMKLSFFSPEHNPMALHQSNFIQKAVGKPFFTDVDGVKKCTKEDIERYCEWAEGKLYLTSQDDGKTPSWSWVIEKFKEQMYSFGTDCFFIDAFNKVKLPKGQNKLDAINDVLTDLTNFAQAYNVVVFLVAHPTKMQKNDKGLYSMPTLYDVSGSSDFRNQTHDGFAVYRYFDTNDQDGYTTFTNLKTKMSFQGEIGAQFNFNFDKATGRYYSKGTNPPRFDMTKPKEEQTEMQIVSQLNEDLKEFDFTKARDTDFETIEEEPF